ncbi:folate-sensitive fragile site protein Fra10Ac1-domain-containing protein [Naematelia encephala]|uniref:Folate-sensitive fragile site protein Fra10Ac1-domain-containing protein n=1 Tax=Naematelia encephala TaxID=71784 RepID=A0A1Y2AQ52_9TREE|nr:folate-sensitive fragile site protein Fra10Ac1-domain-containing protein [Naematelia encephala]
MSWKNAGTLLNGPPTLPSGPPTSSSIAKRYPPNLGGRTAFQRERELAARYGVSESDLKPPRGKTEWDILRENHRFIRDDEDPGDVTWEERLARAYESKLFKEYALIDLKHYKSHRFALRWRSAPEVITGLGETTCASLRCKYHQPIVPSSPSSPSAVTFGLPGYHTPIEPGRSKDKGKNKKKHKEMPRLQSFELPFVYEEAGTRREAMVKVRLCPRCETKLKWKPHTRGTKDDTGSDEDVNSVDEEEEADGNTIDWRRRRNSRVNEDDRENKDHRRRARRISEAREARTIVSPSHSQRSQSRSRSPSHRQNRQNRQNRHEDTPHDQFHERHERHIR